MLEAFVSCQSASKLDDNSESVEVCRTHRGKNNTASPNTMEDRSTSRLARLDSHRPRWLG